MHDAPLIVDIIYTVLRAIFTNETQPITSRGRNSVTRIKELLSSSPLTHGDTDSAMLSVLPE
ncbi:hypothetical protein QKT49_gp246 [Acanthamoeba castellanii medusavirus]|uniref:Uncharacterized protein n=1 Tax=Acanthamoeba castellanii medusavirus J1 TaxID=3114988 RepID=A0A3T1CXE4_9VIRU|nr:hypothetical protein QKT49_gp246 [Acanthamoeba castellanii medusavirus]BBI30517.1 hypothetical protein [Acanthamoeba castellanii medusavirus J1]